MLLSDLPLQSPTRLVAGFLALLTLYFLGRALYNVFLHPLRSYPGPKLWAASRLPWVLASLRGDLAWSLLALHELYGPVVRIAPDELSYTGTGDSWKTIYGRRGPNEFTKCLDGRAIAGPNIRATAADGIISAPHEKHARLRRAVAPAFSERALREQEGFLQLYTGKLVKQLGRCCRDGTSGPQDMQRWYSLFAFDVMSDLAFGQAMGCLDNVDQPWLQVLGARTKSIVWYQVLIYYGLDRWAKYFTPRSLMEARRKHVAMTNQKVQARVQQEDRKDFISYLLQNKSETLTNRELVMMASSFIVAGSGISSAALAGITYFLCKSPDKYHKLCDEIRSAFPSEADITLESTSRLGYLKAVIEEGLRLYPPSPSTFPRFVPGRGEEIEGKWVPGGTAVGVHQFSAGRSSINFRDARAFIPERWLSLPDGSDFADDNRAAMQPFSYGPRNCIGVNMAYAEMRLVLARLLWNFDIELSDDQWMARQKTWLVWHKIPLLIDLKSIKAK
ncbi:Cytochrome P450 monooxygenase alt3 [Apiospora rasikravindrae]|uniref:Cytochrome P450 monooxygenase alt3 n=1 Tax=Apiospora rasikravindrae TaxID=990691 RepID=A0ABR1TY21_9PEZI